MSRPWATLSLDLDDKWAYLRTHGNLAWKTYPSYLPTVVPRILESVSARGLTMTVFVVGRDAEREANSDCWTQIIRAGHEVGNHSMNHYPWLRTLSADEIADELIEGELAIESATGVRTVGFRAPGFSGSAEVRRILVSRGYSYDASEFPTFLGPLARMYARLNSASGGRSVTSSESLFGSWREGLGRLKPYSIGGESDGLLEIPVTTMPILRLPFHMTYLLFLRQKLGGAWREYLRLALALCRLRGVAPSMLLHPLDFLGCEDEPELAFFPGMKLSRDVKLQVVDETLRSIASTWRIVPLAVAAARLAKHSDVHVAQVPALAAEASAL